MVYKSSLGRGFNSSILNSYVLSVLICVSFSITLFVLSVIDAKSLKFLRFTTISFCKPIFIVVGKPFQIFNGLLIYVNEIKLTQEKNKELLEENKRLAKKLVFGGKKQGPKSHRLPSKYQNVNDLQWSDGLEREIFRLRSRF